MGRQVRAPKGLRQRGSSQLAGGAHPPEELASTVCWSSRTSDHRSDELTGDAAFPTLTDVRRTTVWLGLIVSLAALTSARSMSAQAPASAQLPAAADRPVSFATDIKPILQVSCVRCHGRGRSRGGFSIETRELLLKGGEDGQAVVLGKSAESHLIAMVAGLDPDEVMPKKGSRLTSAQVGLLRAWIDQGLPWDADVTFAKAPPRNLTPRAPELPATTDAAANPVDRLLRRISRRMKRRLPPRTDDRTFIRRASLDIVGLLPSPFEVRTFVTDTRSDKRERLVARLLQDDGRYATHWLSFWNDLLRNDYRGTGYIDGGRKQISAWLYASLGEQSAVRSVRPRADRSLGADQRLHQGHRLARRGQREPDATDAGRAERLAGVHGREPEVCLVPRQLHQRLAVVGRVRAGGRSTRTVRSRWWSAIGRRARPRP